MCRELLFLLIGVGLAGSGAGAATIRVDPAGGGDFTAIQPAIDAALGGDEVVVAPGAYILTSGAALTFRGKAITVRSAGGREVTTVTSAAAPVVVFEDGEGAGSVLEGLTLSGALHCDGASPTLRACTIAGVECAAASPELLDCTVTGSLACGVFLGGESAPRFTRSTITANRSRVFEGVGKGGGVYCGAGSTPTFAACRLSGNFAEAPGRGGAVYCEGGSAPRFENCLVNGNLAGAIAGENGAGGAVYCERGAAPVLLHSTVVKNIADILRLPPAPGGALHCEDGSAAVVTGCIFWGNDEPGFEDRDLSQILAVDGATPDVSYSCVQGQSVWPGTGNTREDPRLRFEGSYFFYDYPDDVPVFVRIDGDFRLLGDSPAIDAGPPSGAPSTDFGGATRPCGDVVDMGAHEFCGDNEPAAVFRLGDTNVDGRVDVADAIYYRHHFSSGLPLRCPATADLDDDGSFLFGDFLSFVGWLGGRTLGPPPSTVCRPDPTPGPPCGDYPVCAPPAPRVPDGRFELELNAPVKVQGAPGSTVSFDASVVLFNDDPILGFGVSFLTHGCEVVDTDPTVPFDIALSSILPGGFTAFGTSAFEGTLPASDEVGGLHSLFRLELEATVPESGCTRCVLEFLDDIEAERHWQNNVVVTDQGLGVHRPVAKTVTVEVCATGRQAPGDCNQDGSVDLSDATCVFGFLFLGSPSRLPCGEGLAADQGDLALLDWQPDGGIDLSDGVSLLTYLFLGGPEHALTTAAAEGPCLPILGCPDVIGSCSN